MRKLSAVVLSVLILFTSCSGQIGEHKSLLTEGYETARRCSPYANFNLNGMLYTESFRDEYGEDYRLRFVDFDTMQSAVICSRPNCKHVDSEECSAFGMGVSQHHTNIFGNKLYFFDYGSEWGADGKLITYQDIWQADLDGSSRRKIDTIENVETIQDLVVKGDVAYFVAQEWEHEPHTGALSGYRKNYICSYDFASEKYTNYGLLVEGYHCGMFIEGEYNGGLYLSGKYADAAEDEWQKWNSCRLRFDLESGEITEWDMPVSILNEYGQTRGMFISGGFYGYMDGDDAHIIDSEGNEMVLEDYELSTSSGDIPINGYYFNTSGIITNENGKKSAYTAVDLKTGEILKINKKTVPKWHYVLTYHNGNYIVYSLTGGNDFKKVSPDELFLGSENK